MKIVRISNENGTRNALIPVRSGSTEESYREVQIVNRDAFYSQIVRRSENAANNNVLPDISSAVIMNFTWRILYRYTVQRCLSEGLWEGLFVNCSDGFCHGVQTRKSAPERFRFFSFLFFFSRSLDRFDRNCNRNWNWNLKTRFEREWERDASLDYRAPGNLRSACQFQPWSRSLRAAIRPNGIIKLTHPLRVREEGTWSFRNVDQTESCYL